MVSLPLYPVLAQTQAPPVLYFQYESYGPLYYLRGPITPLDEIVVIANVTSSSFPTVTVWVANSTHPTPVPYPMLPNTPFVTGVPEAFQATLPPQGKPTVLSFYFQAKNKDNLTTR